MVEIRPDVTMQEVMRRTIVNLEFIHEHRALGGPYEVTQLVNSFSGAMIYPWEKQRFNALSGLTKLSLEAARERGWPVLTKELPEDRDPANYHEMLSWIRNAFAHGNIEFGKLEGQIASIRIWNCPLRKPRNWGAKVTVRNMQTFLMFFQELASGKEPGRVVDYPEIYSYAAG